ncbi:Uncharacterized protein PODLI_1B042762 [Podarcis lilfordi]|uniref:P-type domain-containing protein n=1 Tax=Podarcis lilfordi TaxID=74358 RepID=A0AA35K7G5_9SAUR|nr:Uncharacterized protein PODLI_1B042762 [Podarcis lilfordi]
MVTVYCLPNRTLPPGRTLDASTAPEVMTYLGLAAPESSHLCLASYHFKSVFLESIKVNKLDIAMECKQWLLLVAALCLGSVCSQNRRHPPYACQCLMDVQARKRCDSTSAGITAEQCTEKGCCFDATVPDVPWCFKPSGERASLRYAKRMTEPQARVDCGYQGITRKRCKRIGCCFDRKASDTSMCFYPPVNEVSQHCVMDMSAREDCGYPGITAEECQGRGCCFNSYVVSTRWCFYPTSVTGPPKMCGMAPNKRVGCGFPGISADECLKKGCCFEHHQYAQNVPWCFEPLARQGNFSL